MAAYQEANGFQLPAICRPMNGVHPSQVSILGSDAMVEQVLRYLASTIEAGTRKRLIQLCLVVIETALFMPLDDGRSIEDRIEKREVALP